MKQALLIIDIQNDYFPEGKNELHEADKALLKVNQLENSFLSEQKPIIYIQHIKHQLNADFLKQGQLAVNYTQISKCRNSQSSLKNIFLIAF